MSEYTSFSQSNLTAILAEIAVFLDGLTIESIDRAIFAFKEGIKSRTALPADFDPRRAQLACSRILRLMEKNSTAINNVYEIQNFGLISMGFGTPPISMSLSRISHAHTACRVPRISIGGSSILFNVPSKTLRAIHGLIDLHRKFKVQFS